MPPSKLQMHIRVGRSHGTFNAADSKASNFFVNALEHESVAVTRSDRVVELKALEGRLRSAIEGELAEGVRYATQYMMGQTSGNSQDPDKTFRIYGDKETGDASLSSRGRGRLMLKTPGMNTTGAVRWANLTWSTRRRKRQNKNKFFVHTGELQRSLTSMARSIINKTGVVRYQLVEARADGGVVSSNRKIRQKIIPIGKLRITFLPNIYRGDLPGLASGNVTAFDPAMRFEKRVGISGEILQKLQGANKNGFQKPEWHRPLLQPVLTYWTLFRLPRRVGTAMNEILTVANRSNKNYRGI